MSYTYINSPAPALREEYDRAIASVVEQLKEAQGIIAIYRFGNITSPGISDIDLLAVFEDGLSCELTGFEKMNARHRSLFTHGVMALCKSHFIGRQQFTIWSDDHLVWGTQPAIDKSLVPSADDASILKRQIAIEYLLINYIDLCIQQYYHIINVRSSLQHFKGVVYDLDFLSVGEHPLRSHLAIIKKWYAAWFTAPPSPKEFKNWIDEYSRLLIPFVTELFQRESLYLPEKNLYQLAKNISLKKGTTLKMMTYGVKLPAFFASFTGKKYVKAMTKLNNFQLEAPLQTTSAHRILTERLNFMKEMTQYNMQHLPNFMPISTMITSKL
jgi:hypothetical protein